MSRTSRFFGPPVTAGYQAPTAVYWSLFQTGQRPYLTIWDLEAMRREPQVQFGLRILKAPVRTAKWKVEGPDPKVNAFVDAQLKRVWQRALDKILLNLEYGNCAAEVAYDKEDDLVVFKELKDVYPRDAVPLQLRGELAGVEFRGSGIKSGKAARQYPPRSFWLANEPPFGNLYGRSRLSNAWEPWIEKRGRHGAVDIRRLWYVKNAYLGGILRHPAGVLEDAQGRLISCQDYARETLEKLETGGVLILPNSKDEGGDYLWVYEPPAANGTVEDIRDYPKDLDLEILIGMGIPPEVVQAAEVGSGWSGRSVPFLVYLTGEDTIVAQTVEGIDKQIVRPMVEENFGADAKYTVTPISLVDLAKEEEQQAQGGPQQAAMPGGPGAPGGAEQGQAPPGAEGAQAPPGQGQEPPQDVMQALSLAMLDAQADGDPDEVQSLASMAQGDGLDELMAHLGGEQEGQQQPPQQRLSLWEEDEGGTLRLANWQPYLGKRGPKKGQQVGWQNESGRIVYGASKLGTRGAAPETPAPAKTPSGKPVPAPPPKPGKPTADEKRVASSEKAGAILGRALSGEKLTAEHLTELATHLSALTVPQLRSWRQKLSISFGGGTKKEQMVAAIRQFAAGTPLKRKVPAKKPTPPGKVAAPAAPTPAAPAPAPKPAAAPPTPAAAAETPAPAVAPRATAGDAGQPRAGEQGAGEAPADISSHVADLKKVYDSATEGSDEDAYNRKMTAARTIEARLAKLSPADLAKVAAGFGVRAGASKTQTLRNIVDRLKERIDRFHRASDFGATGGGAGEQAGKAGKAGQPVPFDPVSAYGRAAALTDEEMANAEAAVGGMSNSQLNDALKRMGFVPMGATKDALAKQILQAIRERRGAAQRASIIDRKLNFGTTRGSAGKRPTRLSTASPWQPHRGASGLGWLNAATGEFRAQAERPADEE